MDCSECLECYIVKMYRAPGGGAGFLGCVCGSVPWGCRAPGGTGSLRGIGYLVGFRVPGGCMAPGSVGSLGGGAGHLGEYRAPGVVQGPWRGAGHLGGAGPLGGVLF